MKRRQRNEDRLDILGYLPCWGGYGNWDGIFYLGNVSNPGGACYAQSAVASPGTQKKEDKLKYKAPNCSFPFVPGDKLKFCWTFAQYVNSGEQDSEEIKKKCRACEYWEGKE